MEIQLALSIEVQNPNTYTNFIQQHDSSLDPIPTVLGNPVTSHPILVQNPNELILSS